MYLAEPRGAGSGEEQASVLLDACTLSLLAHVRGMCSAQTC